MKMLLLRSHVILNVLNLIIANVRGGDLSRSLRSREDNTAQQITCTLYDIDVTLGEGESATQVMCEDEYGRNIQVLGLMENTNLNWTSGETVVKVNKTILSEDSINISHDYDFEIVHDKRSEPASRRRLQTTIGVHKVLVVRVTANGVGPSFTADQIGDSVFGILVGGIDQYNLASQYDACSYGKLKMVPETSNQNVVNGVVEISISKVASQSSMAQMQSAAVVKLSSKGINTANYDHIMYCLPQPQTNEVAWAQINGRTTLYNNQFCLGLSTQMHEIGHNLGLHHSGLGTDPYLDRSGYMGYSGSNSEKPVQCFNGPNSWQLGWYKDRVVTIDPTREQYFNGKLVGVAHYGASIADLHTVIVRVKNSSGSDDLFVAFNRAHGINFQTFASFRDLVLITIGGQYSLSWLLYSLTQGNTVSIDFGFSRPLMVGVVGNGTDTTSGGPVDFMKVYVGLKCYSDSDCDFGDFCSDDICQTVEDSPSVTPSMYPSEFPSMAPVIPYESISWGSTQVVTTPNASSTTGQKRAYGVMFHVFACGATSVLVSRLDILTPSTGALKFRISTKSGLASDDEERSSPLWESQTSTTDGKSLDSLTTLSFPEPIMITKGHSQVFHVQIYVDKPGDSFMAYNELTCLAYGENVVEDVNLSIKGGYIWSSAAIMYGGPNDTRPRCFNGAIHYQIPKE